MRRSLSTLGAVIRPFATLRPLRNLRPNPAAIPGHRAPRGCCVTPCLGRGIPVGGHGFPADLCRAQSLHSLSPPRSRGAAVLIVLLLLLAVMIVLLLLLLLRQWQWQGQGQERAPPPQSSAWRAHGGPGHGHATHPQRPHGRHKAPETVQADLGAHRRGSSAARTPLAAT